MPRPPRSGPCARATTRGAGELARSLALAALSARGGGAVRGTVDVDEAWAVVAVENVGPRTADGDRDRPFSRFFRAGEARDRGGTGLGVHICKAIAEAHGGDIALDPEADVTRFVVRLRVG